MPSPTALKRLRNWPWQYNAVCILMPSHTWSWGDADGFLGGACHFTSKCKSGISQNTSLCSQNRHLGGVSWQTPLLTVESALWYIPTVHPSMPTTADGGECSLVRPDSTPIDAYHCWRWRVEMQHCTFICHTKKRLKGCLVLTAASGNQV